MHKIDPSQFMLSRDSNSLFQGPAHTPTSVTRSLQLSLRDEHSLPRSPELGSSVSGRSFRRDDQFSATYARLVVSLFNNNFLVLSGRFSIINNDTCLTFSFSNANAALYFLFSLI